MRSTIALPMLVLPRALGCRWMRAVLDYCTGGIQRKVPAGTLVIHEGGTTGHLYVLMEGRLEVLKGDTVVAVIAEPGAVLGEMSVLLDQPHLALLIARLLAQRLNVANTYLADIKRQYAGHGNHLAMVGDILQSMINLSPPQVSPGSDRQSDPRM